MTLISSIITKAYRELNLIAAGQTETAVEQAEGLELLNTYIQDLYEDEAGSALKVELFGGNNIDQSTVNLEFENFVENWFMPKNFRLICNLTSAKSIRLPPRVTDGALIAIKDASGNFNTNNLTLQGNGQNIEGSPSLVLSADSYEAVWFYREDTANWARVTDVLLTDESPFPSRFDDMLAIGLAMRLSPRHGAAVDPLSERRYYKSLKNFKARYKQVEERAPEEALRQLTGRRLIDRSYSVSGQFERGSYKW